ncbi:unnamed protein product [Calypogeia fissa]
MEWLFTCKCARCRLEESLQPQLLKINKKISRLLEAGAGGDAAHSTFVRNAQKDVAELADEVEGLILSHCSKVGPKEHSWIRATFAAAYKAKFALSMDDSGDLPSRMSALRLVLNSFSICYDNIARTYAVSLFKLIGKRYAKHSEISMLAFQRLTAIIAVHQGEQQREFARKLNQAQQFRF